MIACIRKEEVHEDFLKIQAVVKKKKQTTKNTEWL